MLIKRCDVDFVAIKKHHPESSHVTIAVDLDNLQGI